MEETKNQAPSLSRMNPGVRGIQKKERSTGFPAPLSQGENNPIGSEFSSEERDCHTFARSNYSEGSYRRSR